MPLLDGLDKPLSRIHLLLNKGGRFLLAAFIASGSLHKYIGIFLIYAKLRDIITRHCELQLPVLQIQNEVGNNLLGLVSVGIINIASRGRIHLEYLGKSRLYLIQAQAGLLHYLLEVLGCEFVEIFLNYELGISYLFRFLQTVQLQQQTFLQVAGSHSGRLEFLNHLQHLQGFFIC